MQEPKVTGISPKEGPPGTKIIIRGENLGRNAKDLIALRICTVDCLLSAEWQSPNKILARTGPCKGKGDVIVVTLSGGVGTSTVQFRGYFEQTGPVQESAVWVDESKTILPVGYPKNQPLSKLEYATSLDDPLGLMNLKTKDKLQKFPVDDLQELFPDNSGNIIQENFLPAWYLLENHHSASYQDLKSGLEFLKKGINQKTEGPYSFIKTNLITFLGCLDSLEALHHKMEEDKKLGSTGTKLFDILENQLKQANAKAGEMFKDILGNKEKADSTRNALSVVNRFKVLFNLPSQMEKLIQRGEYGVAINDYNRVKALYSNNLNIGIFKKVFEEVDLKIDMLRKTLRAQLFDYPSTLEEQKYILKFLLETDTKSDPAWESITKMASWLTLLLIDCKDRNLKLANEVPGNKLPRVAKPDVSRSDMTISKATPNMAAITQVKSAPDVLSKTEVGEHNDSTIPQVSRYTDELSSLMTQGFYDFWKLGQAYFSGLLQPKEGTEKAYKIDPNKFSRFKYLVNDIISLYTQLVRDVFIPETLADVPPERKAALGDWTGAYGLNVGLYLWLTPTIKDVRICQLSILNMDQNVAEEVAGAVSKVPEESARLLKQLVCDLRVFGILSLLKVATKDIRNLYLKENWKIDREEEGYGCTKLIKCFENLVEEKGRIIRSLIEPLIGGEQETDIFGINRANQKEVTMACTKMVLALAETIEFMAYGISTKESTTSNPLPNNFPSTDATNTPAHKSSRSSVDCLKTRAWTHASLIRIKQEKRLLYCLSNVDYFLNTIIKSGSLMETLSTSGFPQTENIKKKITHTFQELDEKLFESYEHKVSKPIVDSIKPNMMTLSFDWRECPEPTDVKSYARIVIQNCIEVYAEVDSVAPCLIKRLMSLLVCDIFNELLAIFTATQFLTHRSVIQAKLDISCLEYALCGYMTPKTKDLLDKIYGLLPTFSDPTYQKKLHTLQETFKRKNAMNFECLKSNIINL